MTNETQLTPYEEFQLKKYGNILPEPKRLIEDLIAYAERMGDRIDAWYENLFVTEGNKSI